MKLFTARTIEKTFLFESDSRQDFLRMEKTPRQSWNTMRGNIPSLLSHIPYGNAKRKR